MRFVKVDGDPFKKKPRLVKVDGDPFVTPPAPPVVQPPAPPQQDTAWQQSPADEMVGMSGPEAQMAQKTLVANIPFVGDTLAPEKLDAMDAARRQQLGVGDVGEPIIKPSTAAAVSTQGILSYPLTAGLGGSLAKNIGGKVSAGKGLSLLDGLKDVGKMSLLGTGEGVLFGAGTAKEGERLKQGTIQGAIGGTVPVAISAAGKFLQTLGRLTGAGKRLLGDIDSIKLSPEQIDNIKDDVILNVIRQAGGTEQEALERVARFRSGETTLADALGPEGRALLAVAAKETDGAMAPVANQVSQRGKLATTRIKNDLGEATKIKPYRAIPMGDRINSEIKAFQAENYTDDFLNTKLTNQDALHEFLERPSLKKALKRAADRLEDLTGERPDFEEAVSVFKKPGGEDGREIIDIRLADKVQDILDDVGRVDKIKGASTGQAHSIDLVKQWKDLTEAGDASRTWAKVREGYGKLKSRQRNYQLGQEAFRKMDASELHSYYKGLSPAEKEAFKAGAFRDLYNSETNSTINNLGNANVRKKFKTVFGKDSLDNVENIMEREKDFSLTDNLVGRKREAGSAEAAADRLSGGKVAGLPLLGHRRAYSMTGLSFAGADALMEALQTTKLPQSVKKRIVEALTDTNNLEETIKRMSASKDVRDRAALAGLMKARDAATQRRLVTGSLINSVVGGQRDKK